MALRATINQGERTVRQQDWNTLFQRTVDAYFDGAYEEGLTACEDLIAEPGIPWVVWEATFQNLPFYARSLPELVSETTLHSLIERADLWSATSGSPCALPDRLLIIASMVSVAAPLKPRIMLIEMDEFLRKRSVQPLAENPNVLATMTELHPVWHGDRIVVAGIARDPLEARPPRAIVADLAGGTLQNVRLSVPFANSLSRGWAPVSTPRGLRFVSWWEPTEVWHESSPPRSFHRESLRLAPLVARNVVAGSPGISVPEGYLFAVNEPITLRDGTAMTLARFALLDNTFALTALSGQWFVTHRGQDAVTGMTRLHGDLILAIFSNDLGASLVRLPLAGVLPLLRPVRLPGAEPPVRNERPSPSQGRQMPSTGPGPEIFSRSRPNHS